MAERSIVDRLLGRKEEKVEAKHIATNKTFKVAAGIPDVVRDLSLIHISEPTRPY